MILNRVMFCGAASSILRYCRTCLCHPDRRLRPELWACALKGKAFILKCSLRTCPIHLLIHAAVFPRERLVRCLNSLPDATGTGCIPYSVHKKCPRNYTCLQSGGCRKHRDCSATRDGFGLVDMRKQEHSFQPDLWFFSPWK